MSDTSGRRLAATVRGQAWRAAMAAPMMSALAGLSLTVAVQRFSASLDAKRVLAAGESLGQLLAPFTLVVAGRLGALPARAYGAILALAAVSLAVAASVPSLPCFVVGCVGAALAANTALPLDTALWRQNAPDAGRGRAFARVARLGMAANIAAGALMAWWISNDIGRYRGIFAAAALALGVGAWRVSRIPSEPLHPPGRNPLASLAWLWRDRTFGYINLSWMVMGIANLMVLPLRVECLANPRFGFAYAPWRIQLLVSTLPAGVRLLALPLWARWFDHAEFLAVRAAINACFIAAIGLFFLPWLWAQVAGAIGFGLAFGGGDIAWSLWVTKYAPPARTAEYMTAHVFLTGVRGVVAAWLGFALIARLAPESVAALAGTGIAVATVMLIPELRRRRVTASVTTPRA